MILVKVFLVALNLVPFTLFGIICAVLIALAHVFVFFSKWSYVVFRVFADYTNRLTKEIEMSLNGS